MQEFFPVAAGLVAGLALAQVRQPWPRTLLLAVVSAVIGVIASVLAGELAVSWAFVLFDTAQVALASVVSLVLFARWRQSPLR